MFEESLNQFVKIVYVDTDSRGEQNKAIKGTLLKEDELFLTIEEEQGGIAKIAIWAEDDNGNKRCLIRSIKPVQRESGNNASSSM